MLRKFFFPPKLFHSEFHYCQGTKGVEFNFLAQIRCVEDFLVCFFPDKIN